MSSSLIARKKLDSKKRRPIVNLYESEKGQLSAPKTPEQIAEWTPVVEEAKKQNQTLEKHLNYLHHNEKELFYHETHNLKKEVANLQAEVEELSKNTSELDSETQKAAEATPVESNSYQINFLRRLRNLIINFRKNISEANEWLNLANSRSRKRKNFWGRFADKKHGGSQFLLSNEHYVSRSAS